MILFCTIAGAKWGIQILAALLFLQKQKRDFIKQIGFTCYIGSCILLPYCLFQFIAAMHNSFLLSLISAVLVMIVMYYAAVKHLQLAVQWFWGWMCCLTLAISLQLFAVFKIG